MINEEYRYPYNFNRYENRIQREFKSERSFLTYYNKPIMSHLTKNSCLFNSYNNFKQ